MGSPENIQARNAGLDIFRSDQSDGGDVLAQGRKVAVFDLDDTVWAGHIMDLGILAVAHGGLWSSNALDQIAEDLGLRDPTQQNRGCPASAAALRRGRRHS